MRVSGFGCALLLLLLLLTATVQAEPLTRGHLANRLVSITIDEGEAVDVLKLLAAQSELNLTVAGTVEGTVSLALNEVSLVEALDVITASVDATWFIVGNVITVRKAGGADIRELEIKLFPLRYLPAEQARKLISPLLPEDSKIEALGGQGEEGGGGGWDEILEVATYPALLRRVEEIIDSLDRPRPLVAIEVKIIETDVRDDRKLGFDFPDNVSMTFGNLELPGTSADGEGSEVASVTGVGTRLLEGGDWTWGRMTIGEVSLLVDLLIKDGRSTLVSNTRVTTMSNQEAEIEVTTTIPVETLNRFSEGGIVQDIVSFQDLDVSISLKVTPRVNPDSTMVLDVFSSVEEIIGYTGPVGNQRPITSRRAISSSVTMKAGETLGLGGLMKEIEHKTVKKLPLLGQIPLLGVLFQHHTVQIEKTDLIILITPQIVSPG